MRRWLTGCAAIVLLAFVAGGCGGECPIHRALFPSGQSQAPTAAPQVARGQETCPVMGGRINPSIYTDYAGTRVYFCCPRCIETFKKNPERYAAKLHVQGA